jgi:hypothetical protein
MEKSLVANKLNLPENPQLASKIIDSSNEINKTKAEHGFLGRLWGKSSSIPNNIAALSIIILLGFGVLYSLFLPHIEQENLSFTAKECWKTISPIITLALGYIFGEKTKKN